MKRWLVWLGLCLVLMIPAAAQEMSLPEGVRAALDKAQPGGQLIAWNTLERGDEGYMAVMHRDGRNILCFVEPADDGYQLTGQAEHLLPAGDIPAEALWLNSFEGHVALTLDMAKLGRPKDSAYYSFVWEEGVWWLRAGHLGAEGSGLYLRFDARGQAMAVWPPDMGMAYSLVPLTLDMRLSAITRDALHAFCAEAAAAFDAPQLIPDGDAPHQLPQGRVVTFAKNKSWPVYLGPGKQYPRAAEGKGTVSGNGWIQVFGLEGDWLLIQYNIAPGRNRFGWMTASALPRGEKLPRLAFTREAAIVDGWQTDDPMRSGAEIGLLRDSECLVLASMGADWLYVEVKNQTGQPLRVFAPTKAVVLRSSYQGHAIVSVAQADLLDDSGHAIASYFGGSQVKVLAREGGRMKVRAGLEDAPLVGWMAAGSLHLDAAHKDVPYTLSQVDFLYQDDVSGMKGLRAPRADADSVDMNDFRSAALMGYAGDYAHLLQEYGNGPISFFMPRDSCLLLPQGDNLYQQAQPMRLKADSMLMLGPGADYPASGLKLYQDVVISGVPLNNGWFFTLDDQLQGRRADYHSLGYLPLSALEAPGADRPIQLGQLRLPGDEQMIYAHPERNSNQDGVLVRGSKLLLIGESTHYRLARNAQGNYVYVEQALVQPLDAQGFQQQPQTLGLGRALLRLPDDLKGIWDRPFPNWGQRHGPMLANGQEVLLLARLLGWWQVHDGQGGSGFVPDAWLPGAPDVPPITSLYDHFRDARFMADWRLNPPLFRHGDSVYAALKEGEGLRLSRYELVSGAWQEAASWPGFLGEGLRLVTNIRMADNVLCLDAYQEGSELLMRPWFSLEDAEPRLLRLDLIVPTWAEGPQQPERQLYITAGGIALQEGGQSRPISMALPALGAGAIQLAALAEQCLAAIAGQ